MPTRQARPGAGDRRLGRGRQRILDQASKLSTHEALRQLEEHCTSDQTERPNVTEGTEALSRKGPEAGAGHWERRVWRHDAGQLPRERTKSPLRTMLPSGPSWLKPGSRRNFSGHLVQLLGLTREEEAGLHRRREHSGGGLGEYRRGLGRYREETVSSSSS